MVSTGVNMRVLTLIPVLLALSAPLAAEEVLLRGTGNSELRLTQKGKAVKVTDASGRMTPVRFKNRTSIDGLVELENGWAIVGTRLELEHRVLSLTRHDITGTHVWLPPTHHERTHRVRPTLMVSEGQPTGLVWLEGEEATGLSVKAADWTGVAWEPAELVSKPGDGTQTALTASVLEDGSWLLLWSRFDGDDDEIFWSVRQDMSWSEPSRISEDNEVPDIMPALISTSNGAVAAWNHFNGEEYALVVSRFDGESWSEAEEIAGGGSLYPGFTRTDEAVYLTYQSVARGTWNVVEMDSQGDVQRHAAVENETTERPIVVVDRWARASLHWADGEKKELANSWNQVIR